MGSTSQDTLAPLRLSPKFAATIFREQGLESCQYFEEQCRDLFLTDPSQSQLWFSLRLHRDRSESLPPSQSAGLHPAPEVRHETASSAHTKHEEVPRPIPEIPARKLAGIEDLRNVLEQSERRTRIFFIRQRTSYTTMSLTHPEFECLMEECDVFVPFREFAILFGRKTGDYDPSPPSMRFCPLLDQNGSFSLNGFECAYTLRRMELNYRSSCEPWSARQFAVYNKYSALSRASTWIFIALTRGAEARLADYANKTPNIWNPFEVHSILLDAALENWTPYFAWLATEIAEQENRVFVYPFQPGKGAPATKFSDRRTLKLLENKVLDMMIMLESTFNTISLLEDRYSAKATQLLLYQTNQFDLSDDPISHSFKEHRRRVLLLKSKAAMLRTKVISTTNLLSALLDLNNGTDLSLLAKEAQTETQAMKELTKKSMQDALAVKVLTIMTLVYLPTTVVANFFSTQFVSQTASKDGKGFHLVVASNWWILVAASIPLTLATLYIWWVWVQKQVHGKYPGWLTPESLLRQFLRTHTRRRSQNVLPDP